MFSEISTAIQKFNLSDFQLKLMRISVFLLKTILHVFLVE